MSARDDSLVINRVLSILGRIHTLGMLGEDVSLIWDEDDEKHWDETDTTRLPAIGFINPTDWLIQKFPTPALVRFLVEEIDEMYCNGAYTGEAEWWGIPGMKKEKNL